MAACPNAALEQVNQFWTMLDDLVQNNPGAYKTFIERQMRDGAEHFSPPEAHTCLRTSIQKPEETTLYVNICGWRRVSVPSSPTHPVPVCGGRMEMIHKENKKYNVVEVAFNPEVLQSVEKDPQEKEQLHLLALSFIQQQHKVTLSKHFTVIKAKLMGHNEDMKHRLTSLQQTKANTPNRQPEPAPLMFQQIRSLAVEDTSNSTIQLSLSQAEEGQARPGLIEVISSTESAQPKQPKHQLIVGSESLKLHVELPGVSSVSMCELSISQHDVLLEVEDLYHLHLQLPEPLNEDECHAVFSKKKHVLTVTALLL